MKIECEKSPVFLSEKEFCNIGQTLWKWGYPCVNGYVMALQEVVNILAFFCLNFLT